MGVGVCEIDVDRLESSLSCRGVHCVVVVGGDSEGDEGGSEEAGPVWASTCAAPRSVPRQTSAHTTRHTHRTWNLIMRRTVNLALSEI